MPDLASLINKYSLIRQIPIFAKLNWFELHQVATKSQFIEYKKGHIISSQGTPPDAFYCLVSGRLQAYAVDGKGQKDNVEFLVRGMHFGIVSLLTGEKHSLTFEAINDSVVLKIAKDDFSAILRAIPRLGLELSQSLSRRIRSHRLGTKSIFESTIISIYSPVSGSGSSTYAINLAISLQKETKRKVVLVNINSIGEHQSPQSADMKEASPQWKKGAVELKDIIGDHDKIIDSVLKADLSIGILNVVFDPRDESIVSQIGQFVSTLANDYHYVIVDLPNNMDDVVLQALIQSDMVHLLSQDQSSHLRLTRQVISRLKQSLKEGFDLESLQVVVRGIADKCYLSYEEINQTLNHNVTLVLPYIHRTELKEAVVSEDMTVITPNPRSEYAQTITRIARKIGGVRVGLVLGGGAALGVAHVGVIRVLEQENIPIDIVVGSSMGALIGAMWVTGRNVDQLEEIAREFQSKRSLFKLFDPIFPKAALIGGRAIRLWLKKHLGHKTFYGTRVPLKVVAYDLVHREELVIEEGSLVDAVRKSIAIPGVINPILENERLIIDGGVLNPLPTNVLTTLGINKIIAINVLQSPEQVSQGYEEAQNRLKQKAALSFWRHPGQYLGVRMEKIMMKIFWPNISDIIIRSLQATEYVIAEQSAQHADVVIHPDLTGINWFELYQVDELLERGEAAARAQLTQIRELVNN